MTVSELTLFLSHAVSEPEAKAKLITKKYKSISALANASFTELSEALCGDMKTTVYIKLAFAIHSRVNCNRIKSLTLKNEQAISKYLASLYINRSVETVFLLSFDKAGKFISSDKVGEGTVNASTVIPRKLLEIARRRSAYTVLVAHNHPMGEAIASEDDVLALSSLEFLFADAGIRFFGSYVVADNECIRVERNDPC